MPAVLVDTISCIGCGQCARDCPFGCITIQQGKAVFAEDACWKCGHCFAVCPVGAIEMFGQHAEPGKFDTTLVRDAVRMRRSVRRFSGALDHEYIRGLVNETRYCASARNVRPLHFMVLDRPKMDELAPLAGRVGDKFMPGVARMQAEHDMIYRGAPHMILTYIDGVDKTYSSAEDAAIALATLELLCVQDGVGTFWAGLMRLICQDPEVLAVLGLYGKVVHSCMAIGKSAVSYRRPVAREDVDLKFV